MVVGMDLTDEIQNAIKNNEVIIGYKKSIKFIKLSTPKLIVIAKNAPEKIRKEIEYNVRISKSRVEVFQGSSRELGILCGKPFPVTTLIIK